MNTPPDPSTQLMRSLKRAGLMILLMIVLAAGLMGYANYRFQQELKEDGPPIMAIPPQGPRLPK